LLAGWCLSGAMWEYQIPAMLDSGHRAVTIDRRGHGRSELTSIDFDYDTLAADIASVLHDLDVHDATLIGHSMGAGEALRYLSRHGHARVRKCVLLAPFAPFLLDGPDNPTGLGPDFFDAIRTEWRRDFPRWLRAGADGYFARPDMKVSDAIVDWTVADMCRTSLAVAEAFNRAAVATDLRPDARQIQVPTLVIHGDADQSAPLDLTGRVCADLVPGATLSVYAGAPHGLYVTHADRLNRDLLAFAQ
jgi:non-heme chloroperoxidase